MKQYLNAGEIAQLEGISRATVTRYIRAGLFGDVRQVAKEWRVPIVAYERWRESTRLKNHRKGASGG